MILFSGCSFTYGDELSDPTKERFSSYFDSHNIGQCGICNDAIVRNTISEIESNPKKYDTVVVQFTLHTRTEVSLQDGYLPITPQNIKYATRKVKQWKFAKVIYKNELWTTHIGKENINKNIFFMQTFLRMKRLKYIFLSIDRRNPRNWTDYTDSCWKNMIDSPITNIHDIIGYPSKNPEYFYKPTGQLADHPNSLGHQVISNAIKERL